MDTNVQEITDETRNKLRDFDEQDAYFLLCEIFSLAQATKDYAKFQNDLSEWKKRFNIELFSEEYRRKIKYMLSKEFLDTVLKNFTAFDELSKKDPSKGLEKLRKILDKAEKHKNAKQLDKDLETLYLEYPLNFLKEKYPHVVGQLLSKSNRTRILEKFDSSLAFKELNSIVEKSQSFNNAEDYKSAIEEWQKLYPTSDFNDKFKGQVEKLLNETLDEKNIQTLFPNVEDLNLSDGQIIPIEVQQNISKLNKDALHDFFKIVDRNRDDINGLFDWICQYSQYINSFDLSSKTAIVNALMLRYSYELPPSTTQYQIPKMMSGVDDLLSMSEFNSINDAKKQSVLQLLGILSNGLELTNEDIYRLNIINSNVQKVKIIEKSKFNQKLDWFMDKFPENKLTLTDEIYLSPISDTRIELDVNNNIDLTLHTDENNDITIENKKTHIDNKEAFKTSLQVDTVLERINSNSTATGAPDSTSSSGGSSLSITSCENEPIQTSFEETLEPSEKDKETLHEENTLHSNPVQNFFRKLLNHNIPDSSKEDERDTR